MIEVMEWCVMDLLVATNILSQQQLIFSDEFVFIKVLGSSLIFVSLSHIFLYKKSSKFGTECIFSEISGFTNSLVSVDMFRYGIHTA